MKRILVATVLVLAVFSIMIFVFQKYRIAADIHPDEQLTVDETTRKYRLVIPHKLTKPAPVVFAFHGIGDSIESMAAYSQLDRLAADNGFILVYPATRKSMWATTEINIENPDDNEDVRFFDLLLEQISSRFEIDRRRIYIMGMSNGASFAQILAAVRPRKISAVVAHSGAMPCDIILTGEPLPIMLIVGAEDASIHSIRSDADTYRSLGHKVEFIVVPGLSHEWSTGHNTQIWSFFANHAKDREP